jgi:hypothetical protein
MVYLLSQAAYAQDPLSSWNDAAPKKAIIAFVGKVAKEGSSDFAPPNQRIAVFDNHALGRAAPTARAGSRRPIPLQRMSRSPSATRSKKIRQARNDRQPVCSPARKIVWRDAAASGFQVCFTQENYNFHTSAATSPVDLVNRGWGVTEARNMMNLEVVQSVLNVSEAQPFDFVKLRGRRISYEVQEMESAGLVELSAAQTNDPDSVVIKTITDAGRRLLRILRDETTTRYLKRARALYGLPPIDLEMVLL